MDIITLIKTDNEELLNRIMGLSETQNLIATRQWSIDALSSETAKGRVLYQYFDKNPDRHSFPEDLKRQLEVVMQDAVELKKVIRELLHSEPKDYEWPEWYSSTINLLRDKNRAEEILLTWVPEFLSEVQRTRFAAEFEKIRNLVPTTNTQLQI